MAKVKDCPGFETFGKDVKNARLEMRISRQKLAEILHISQVYLANIENDDSIPSLPMQVNSVSGSVTK